MKINSLSRRTAGRICSFNQNWPIYFHVFSNHALLHISTCKQQMKTPENHHNHKKCKHVSFLLMLILFSLFYCKKKAFELDKKNQNHAQGRQLNKSYRYIVCQPGACENIRQYGRQCDIIQQSMKARFAFRITHFWREWVGVKLRLLFIGRLVIWTSLCLCSSVLASACICLLLFLTIGNSYESRQGTSKDAKIYVGRSTVFCFALIRYAWIT